MTTLNLKDVTADQRRTLLNANLARTSSRHSETRVGLVLDSLMNALAGTEEVPDVDASALDRRDLSTLVRVIESAATVTPNCGPLTQFALDIVAADLAAHPGALPLRTV